MDQNNPKQQPNHNLNQHHTGIDDQQTGFVVGAVVGALVGGAAALLLSPKNGKEMRSIVKKYTKELESEMHDLAKDSKGVATSFRSVLEESATDVMEQAPEKIEQAGYQAQQLAEDLSHRFESARDVVSELAEAFRSGWEEYGEDHPEDEFKAAPALFDEDLINNIASKSEAAAAEPESVIAAPVQSRRRVNTESGYSMHASQSVSEEVKEEPAKKAAAVKDAVSAPARRVEVKAKEEKAKPVEKVEKESAPKPRYETRVLEKHQPSKNTGVSVKAKEPVAAGEAKAEEKPRKKLLFRRSK